MVRNIASWVQGAFFRKTAWQAIAYIQGLLCSMYIDFAAMKNLGDDVGVVERHRNLREMIFALMRGGENNAASI